MISMMTSVLQGLKKYDDLHFSLLFSLKFNFHIHCKMKACIGNVS